MNKKIYLCRVDYVNGKKSNPKVQMHIMKAYFRD